MDHFSICSDTDRRTAHDRLASGDTPQFLAMLSDSPGSSDPGLFPFILNFVRISLCPKATSNNKTRKSSPQSKARRSANSKVSSSSHPRTMSRSQSVKRTAQFLLTNILKAIQDAVTTVDRSSLMSSRISLSSAPANFSTVNSRTFSHSPAHRRIWPSMRRFSNLVTLCSVWIYRMGDTSLTGTL